MPRYRFHSDNLTEHVVMFPFEVTKAAERVVALPKGQPQTTLFPGDEFETQTALEPPMFTNLDDEQSKSKAGSKATKAGTSPAASEKE